MQIESILRRLQPHPGFVYARAEWVGTAAHPAIHVHVRPRKGSKGVCSTCFQKRPGYDQLGTRWFAFVPFWVRIPADLGSGSDLIWAPFRSAWALGRSAATGGGQVGG